MKTATIRDLRTRFPEVRKLLEREGEVVVTDRGKPVVLLRNFDARAEGVVPEVAYYERLRRRMPKRLSAAGRRALDAEDRGER
jgi:antitoxin (DNA-binding transcriptional repressor) of toxin-antitoxin stability system